MRKCFISGKEGVGEGEGKEKKRTNRSSLFFLYLKNYFLKAIIKSDLAKIHFCFYVIIS